MTGYNFGFANCFGFSGSSSLAQILYQTSLGDFTYNTDSNGDIVLTNQGSFGTSYDALPYSGRGIELGALNDVDIPIHHTLGANEITGSIWSVANSDETTTFTSISASAFDLAVTVAGTSSSKPTISIATSALPSSSTYVVSFTATGTVGTCRMVQIYNGTFSTFVHEVVDGHNEFKVSNIGNDSTSVFSLYMDGRTTWSISVTDFLIEQITNPNSYVTIYDFSTGFNYIDCSTLTPSTTYNIVSKTVNNILTHTTAWGIADKAKIENNPNLVGKLALETLGATKTIPELDIVMDAGASADKWFMCADRQSGTLTCARTSTTTTISNWVSTIETNADLQPSGIQTTAFVLDANGVPTAYSSNLLQFNGDGRYVDAGFFPPGDSAWEIDMVMFFSANGEYELSGIQTVATGNIVYLGKKNTNVPRAYIGGIALDGAAVTLEAYHYLTLTFDGAGNGKFIVDNTSEYPYASSLYALLAGESFFVGSTSRGGAYIGNNHRNQIGIFSYVTRQRTSLERAAAYAKAKAIYTTLP